MDLVITGRTPPIVIMCGGIHKLGQDSQNFLGQLARKKPSSVYKDVEMGADPKKPYKLYCLFRFFDLLCSISLEKLTYPLLISGFTKDTLWLSSKHRSAGPVEVAGQSNKNHGVHRDSDIRPGRLAVHGLRPRLRIGHRIRYL